ncbi:Crp/Fnr family transcriptional regulator [Pseudorhodoferax sp. Leaf267]|uniref:Crp/Fnr family transcriptional regulator n=1 Tax=Pseudorhodoferax sp. Leaf267 TaxID=1736316 RepID=UPI0009EB93E7|nr:Crp/Fnr family transcriptional regulator [Pseudorhodoferax sp. Leaf267]
MNPADFALDPPRCVACPLRKCGNFLPVDDAVLAFIDDFRSETQMLPAGETLIREQSKAQRVFTLFSGWAFRYKTLSDGRRQILNFMLPGDFFGLQQQFTDGATYGVEALTEVAVCVFPAARLWDLYRAHPQLGYDVTWLSAREEQMLDENLLTTGRRSAIERVAVLLIHLFKRAQRVNLVDADNGFAFPLTQQHVADALGLSLVHTNRTLRRLQQLGLHELADGRMVLRNAKALKQLADYVDHPLNAVPLI